MFLLLCDSLEPCPISNGNFSGKCECLELLASGLLVWLVQGSTDRRVAMIRKRSLTQRQRATRVDVETRQQKKAVGSSGKREKQACHWMPSLLRACWCAPPGSLLGVIPVCRSCTHLQSTQSGLRGCRDGTRRKMLKKGSGVKKRPRVHHRRSFQSHTYQSLLAVRTPETTRLSGDDSGLA